MSPKKYKSKLIGSLERNRHVNKSKMIHVTVFTVALTTAIRVILRHLVGKKTSLSSLLIHI